MKKLILAPAVALAFTGLVAAPVAAAEAPSTQSASAKAEQAKKEKAEQLAKEKKLAKEKAEEAAEAKKAEEEKAAKKKAAQEKEDAAKEKAADAKADEESGDDAKDTEKPAPKDDDSKSSDDSGSKDDSDAKSNDKNQDSEDPKDEVEKPNASVKVASSISAEDLAKNGLKVTVTHLEQGDKVAVKGSGLSAESTTAAGGSATLTLQTDTPAEDIDEGAKSLSIRVARTGPSGEASETRSQTLNTSTKILAAEDDPKITLSDTEVSESDFNKDGITVTGGGFTPNGDVEINAGAGNSFFQKETVTADDNGEITVPITAPDSGLAPGRYTVAATDAATEEAAEQTFTITEDDAVDPIDASLKVDPTEITAEDLSDPDKGVTVTVTGVKKGDKLTDSLTGDAKMVEADGAFEFTLYYQGNPDSLEEGKVPFTVTIDREGTESQTLNGNINVVDDDAVDPIDASLKVDPTEITAEDLANKDKGITVTVSGVKKGDKITDSLTGDTETADADGDYKLHLYYQGNPNSLEEGKVPFTVTIDREGTESQTLNGNINVVAEDKEDGGDDGDNGDGGDNGDDGDTPEAPAEASFSVTPKTMEAADFANEKKGVTLAVENCEPGADVHFAVTPKGIQVTAYENTVKADDEGKASVNVFGTSDNVSAYVGSYTASAMCGDDSMKESFTVTAGANGGGSDDGNGGNDGSELPRTGADLGGLASGAMLLLVGGAAIAMTGRRKKVGQSPSDF